MKMKKDEHIIECIPHVKNVWERYGYVEVDDELTKEEYWKLLNEKGIEYDKRWGLEKLKELL